MAKNISGDDLIDAVWRVRAGDAVFSSRLPGSALEAFANGSSVASPHSSGDPELDQLTTRERQVQRLIARGYAYKSVARELNIAPKTVESHVSSALRKLQLSIRYEFSHWASERRLT